MNTYKQFAENLRTVFQENALALCELDRLAGDGDHGLTISRGFSDAAAKTAMLPDTAMPAEVFKQIGYAMLASMGGASGPIFSTFFIQAAIVLNGKTALTGELLKEIIESTIFAIHDLAGTERGDKTMVDALYGALDALDSSDCPIEECLALAARGAQKGAEDTVEMTARKGRAKFTGDRSRGYMDAGSKSVSLIFDTMYQTFSHQKESKHV